MLKKFTRFIIQEPRFLLSTLAILILLVVIVIELKALHKNTSHLRAVKAEKDLVLKTDEMKETLRLRKINLALDKTQKPDLKFNLEGTILQDGNYHALINGTIYKKDDQLSGFQITSINKSSVTLQNIATGQLVNLRIADLPVKQRITEDKKVTGPPAK